MKTIETPDLSMTEAALADGLCRKTYVITLIGIVVFVAAAAAFFV
jgi:hypothetical protein